MAAMTVTLKSFAKAFFHRHQPLLEETHPGISCHILIGELEGLGEDLDGIFFPQVSSSVANVFFDSLLKGVPFDYISKKCHFFGSCFEIREKVFIPRSETEILVEDAVGELLSCYGADPQTPVKILDVGTGSGNILLSILQEYPGEAEAVGVDISQEALDLAHRNAFRLQYNFSKNKTIRFIRSDRLSKLVEQFHLIVSNPPYIKEKADRKNIHPQVARWEPAHALCLEDEHYQNWFEKFFVQVSHALFPGGAFFMEGHERHLKELERTANAMGVFASVVIKNDYTSRNRFLIARK